MLVNLVLPFSKMLRSMKRFYLSLALLGLAGSTLLAQDRGQDQARMVPYEPGYYQNTILPAIDEYQQSQHSRPRGTSFEMDMSGKAYPKDPSDYKQVWHHGPTSQGRTGTCWCFSTTSFYESEVKRLTGKEVRLSEMFTVYWEYVERARYFVQARGDMHLGQGSEANAVARMMKKYGIVPRSAYGGSLEGQRFFDHRVMFEEIKGYLHSVRERHAWNEAQVVATVRNILDHYMGRPPQEVTVKGKTYSPREYLQDYLKMDLDDYVDFMSLMNAPFWQQGEYDVPDNWWQASNYYNVPLKDFYTALESAIDEGYSISIGGDVSEPGFENNVALVPDFDIPSSYIDQDARQMRFENGSTTDDHAMHLVGYRKFKGDTWFLVKDSGSGSRNCGSDNPAFGYYFFHEDYIRLKIMNTTMHRDAAKRLLKRFSS